ncbi:hypothetical protein HJG60_012127 [Phyllostomus discolor]|uniref:Uncharacterized protein n=1 Tax=Phyllostomus discolor TaxID=89673 RepID=A0A833ZJI0_9CHIR|nr:hypothetical protein HJG60_012127 [Phyllostomus discolor]
MPLMCSSRPAFVHFEKRGSVCRWVVWATTLTVLKDQICCDFGLKKKKTKLKLLLLKDHLLILNIYNSWVKIFITLLPIGYFWVFCFEGAVPSFFPNEKISGYLFTLFLDALNTFPGYLRKCQ